MIGNDQVLAIIAGRGGSKGLPRKNVHTLAGKPLIAWSIEASAQSLFLDRTIISTDDAEIAQVARECGGDVPFQRPTELATDSASIVDAVIHAANQLSERYDYVVLLQATSPLRFGSDIDGAIQLCHERQAPACISVTSAPKTRWTMEMDQTGKLTPLFGTIAARRQELPDAYQPNGAVYVAKLDWLKSRRDFYAPETVGYVMPAERSIDIDTLPDLLLAEALFKQRTLRP